MGKSKFDAKSRTVAAFVAARLVNSRLLTAARQKARKERQESRMLHVFKAALIATVLAVTVVSAVGTSIAATWAMQRCAGMERVQSQDGGSQPDRNFDKTPKDETLPDGSASPRDNGAGRGNLPQPDDDEPPGCVYKDRLLDLIV